MAIVELAGEGDRKLPFSCFTQDRVSSIIVPPSGQRILGQCRAQSRAVTHCLYCAAGGPSRSAVLLLHLHLPPHTEEQEQKGGEGPQPASSRRPTSHHTLFLPASSSRPAELPDHLPTCAIRGSGYDSLSWASFLVLLPADAQVSSSCCKPRLGLFAGSAIRPLLLAFNELNSSCLKPLPHGTCRCVALHCNCTALRCAALHRVRFLYIYAAHERDLAWLRLHHRRTLALAAASIPPTPGPTAQFRVCRHPAIPPLQSLPHPDDSESDRHRT